MGSEVKTLKTLLQSDQGCPDELEIYEFAHQRETDGSRAIEIHLRKCAHCAAALSLYKDFEAASPKPEEEADVKYVTAQLREHAGEMFETARAQARATAPAPRKSWLSGFFSTWRLPAVSMAAAAMFVAVGIYVTMRTAPEVAVHNLSNPSAEVRSLQIELVSPIGDLTAAPEELSWKPVSGATRYEVRIMEVDRTELWKADTSLTTIRLANEIHARIVPAKKLLWQVSAFDAAGRQIAASDTGEFRLTAGARQ